MRKVVVIEGKLLPNGMMLAKGALKDPGKPIPVTMGYDHMTIVGKAVDFERNDETGEISFDIQFSPEYAGGEDLIEDAEIQLSAYGVVARDESIIDSAMVGEAVFVPFAASYPKVFSCSQETCPTCKHPLTCEWHPIAGECHNTATKILTVGELIEKLKEFDPDLPVATNDDEYGLEVEVSPRLYSLSRYEGRVLTELGMEEGDRIVVID